MSEDIYPADGHDEWLDIATVCQIIGGTRPIHPSTFYRGVKSGIYPAPEPRGAQLKRVSRNKLTHDLRLLLAQENLRRREANQV